MENYYNVLNVPETATMEDIKKSYRKLSLKWHPDRNPGNTDAEETFKKINEAYETLGSLENKNSYDISRKNPFAGGGVGGINLDDLFANLFFRQQSFGEGVSMTPGLESLGRFPPGANVHIFRNGINIPIPNQKPPPIHVNLTITMEMVLTGGSLPVDIERWIIEGINKVNEIQTIYVTIPKGIDNNEIIVLEEKGNISSPTCKGDVKVFIKIENDTEYQRRGLDLIFNKNISLKESLCGFSFEMKYINGIVYTINNKQGNVIPPEYQKIIPNMGLTRDVHVGNLIIIFHVEFPTSISLENVEKLKQLL